MKEIFKEIWQSVVKASKHDITHKIMAFCFSFLVWFIVSVNVYPTISEDVYGVEVTVEIEGSYAESVELQPVSVGTQTVNVRIEGKRSEIADISAKDLVAYVNVDNVTSAREYKLPVEVKSVDGKAFQVLSVSPSSIAVKFDKIITKSFNVEPDISSISAMPGYFKGEISVTPATINITGPQNRIDNITNVYAKTTVSKELKASAEVQSDQIVLFNENTNAEISNDDGELSLDKSSFTIIIPIYVKQTVPLEVEIQNTPAGFDVDAFKKQLILSETEIDIGAPSDSIRDINSFVVGIIDMRKVDIGSVFEFEVILGENYTNLSGIDKVTVTCPSEGLAKKRINLRSSDFAVINAPAQFDITPINSGYSIDFIGPEEIIADLSKPDVVAVLDLMPYEIEEGTFACPVQISVPSHPEIWTMGTFNISLTASIKEEPEPVEE